MEIAIPFIVIAIIFAIASFNKSLQEAAKRAASQQPEQREPQQTFDPYYPVDNEYDLPDYGAEAELLETIDDVAEPFSYENDRVEPVMATPTMPAIAPSMAVDSEIKDEIAMSDMTKEESGSGLSSDLKDFDLRKAVIYSEIIKPKYQ